MSKKKRFEHRIVRPSLAASLEAVRQGREIKADEKELPSAVEPAAAKPKQDDSANETGYVKAEVKRIAAIMGALLVFLIVLAYLESTGSILTNFAQRFIR